jgi:nucleoside-diphosphate-sugar epimerase
MGAKRLLILGCGYAGRRVLELGCARGLEVIATVRSEARAAELAGLGARVIASARLEPGIASQADAQTHVVVAFPPDEATDARIAPAFGHAHSIAYISSTGVYGERRGAIDDATPLPPAPDARGQRILDAEACWRAVGATVLRCPGIYGPDRGLHVRVLRGQHRMPGDGSRTLSRIHVEDLAQLVLATERLRGETFVVGDLAPAPQREVVQYLRDTYGAAWPESAPLESLHPSLRADRAVDPRRALEVLSVTLRYPSYREGMSSQATGIAPRPTGHAGD